MLVNGDRNVIIGVSGAIYTPSVGAVVPLSDATAGPILIPSEDPSNSQFVGCNAVVDLTPAEEGSLGILTKTVTNNGAPLDGVGVLILGVDTDSLGNDTCNTAAILGAQLTGDVTTSPFNGPGQATFFLQGGLKYCIEVVTVDQLTDVMSFGDLADITPLGGAPEIVFVPVTGLDPADAVVVTNDVTGLIATINVTAEFDCTAAAGCGPDGVADVTLYTSSPLDTATDCFGTYITDTFVADGDTTTFVVSPGSFCVEATVDTVPSSGTTSGVFTDATESPIVVAGGDNVDVTLTLTEQ